MRVPHKSLKPKVIVGERLYLRPYRKSDLKFKLKWMNDKEILALTGEVKSWSRRDLDKFYDRVKNEKDRAWFSIVLKERDRVIGETGLLRAFWPWKGTDLTIEINERDVWNHGYGTEAINLLLSWAFETLGFHRVSIGVVGFNERALHFYEKNGFRREGLFRDGYLHGGKYYDFIMMSILEHEFRNRKDTTGHGRNRITGRRRAQGDSAFHSSPAPIATRQPQVFDDRRGHSPGRIRAIAPSGFGARPSDGMPDFASFSLALRR